MQKSKAIVACIQVGIEASGTDLSIRAALNSGDQEDEVRDRKCLPNPSGQVGESTRLLLLQETLTTGKLFFF